MWETWVQSLGWEDPLEKGKATHSSILAWRILSRQELDMTKWLSLNRPEVSQMVQNIKQYQSQEIFLIF